MPSGPNGENRPDDVIETAIKVGKIATGEITEKNKAAQEMGRVGGPARAKSLSAERRSEIAAMAAKKRWGRP